VPSQHWQRAFPLFDLAPEGGCLAADIATRAGGLLHHLFTLTHLLRDVGGMSLWPCPRVAPPGRCPASHPLESGLSSRYRVLPRQPVITWPTQAHLHLTTVGLPVNETHFRYASLAFRSSHNINSGGARRRARGAPKPSIPNPRLT